MSGLLGEEPRLMACSSSKGKKKKTKISVVSGDGIQMVPCSSLERKRTKKKHVLIYYHRHGINHTLRGLLVCVPIESLIPFHPSKNKSRCKKNELELPCSGNLNYLMSCICTTSIGGENSLGPGIYFFGGLDPPAGCPLELQKEHVLNKVYCYDLHKLPREVGSITPRDDMIYGMSNPLLVQVGDDCIYVLGIGKTGSNNSLGPAFQKYNIKENKWSTPDNTNHFVDMMSKCDCDDWVRRNLNYVPHVVIGHKLHVSLGNSSFAFDTVSCVWEDSKLFETFWLKQKENKRSRLSPLDFYGSKVWSGAVDVVKKRKREEEEGLVWGPPFGFSGRGVVWDKNILLGVHDAPNVPLVAFLLDVDGRVIKSQPISLDNLVMDDDCLSDGAFLVDLGRGGYFGLVHLLSDKTIDIFDDWNSNTLLMELMTFKVSRAPKIAASNQFVVCQFVSKKVVARDCPDSCGNFNNAFSV